MKTKEVTKAEILQALMKTIDKHTPKKHDLFYVLNAISQTTGFLADQRYEHHHHVMSSVKYLKEDLTKSKNSYIGIFESLTESAVAAQILAGQCTEGLNILTDLNPELEILAAQVEENMQD